MTTDENAPPGIGEMHVHRSITECQVYARTRYNHTGIQVEAGFAYRLAATGEWRDAYIRSGPDGYGRDQVPVLFRPMFRMLERCRNHRTANWFELLGSVGKDGSPFRIGSGCASWTAPASGELICFANDLDWMRWNNAGSVALTVARPSDAGETDDN